MRSSLCHLTRRTVLNSISHSTGFSDNLDRLMPTAESQETMHLFIDFLAERGCVCVLGERAGGGSEGCCQPCAWMSTWMCPCSSCMYVWQRGREGKKKQKCDSVPKETQREHGGEEERDNRHIQGNCFLSHSSCVCPSTPAMCRRRK